MRIVCGQLVDGVDGIARQDCAIDISDLGRIIAIGATSSIPPGVETIDLSGLTVIPGLIDCHDHLGIDVGDEDAQCGESTGYYAARSSQRATEILNCGITTLRDLGEKGHVGQDLRRAVAEGVVHGPRLLVAGRPIVRTGGHASTMGVEADGPFQLRRAVRQEVKRGADLIKVMATGGVSTRGSNVLRPEFTRDEIRAVVDEAHRLGVRVAAHGHGGQGVRDAVEAGVDSIEHGMFLNRADLELMCANGTALVVTIGVMRRILRSSGDPTLADQQNKLIGAIDSFAEVLSNCTDLPLTLAVGTDENHGMLYEEMMFLNDVGFGGVVSFAAGTRVAAELCGMGDEIGTLEPGKWADLVGVFGNPLTSLNVLSDVPFVMKGGIVYKQPFEGRVTNP